eukprot:4325-Heterococcus_DN1.PRE.3
MKHTANITQRERAQDSGASQAVTASTAPYSCDTKCSKRTQNTANYETLKAAAAAFAAVGGVGATEGKQGVRKGGNRSIASIWHAQCVDYFTVV